jgi:hypothetical protein
VRGRVIRVNADLTDGDREAWAALAQRASEPNPFHEPDAVVAAARHLPTGDTIKLAVVENDDRFFACLPVQHVRRHWRDQSEPSYQFATTEVRRMNYLGTPLFDTSKGVEPMTVLLETLVEECRSEGSVAAEFGDVAAGGTVDSYLREAAAGLGLKLDVIHTFDRGLLRREEIIDGEALHSGKTLRNLRSKKRAMGRALEGEVTVKDRFDDESIAEYIRIEESGYKAETGNAMTSVPGEPQQFAEMCHAFAAAGRFHLLSLMVDSTTTAMMGWVTARDSVFQFKWSYDSRYAKFSPGKLIHLEAIERFQNETDAELLETCTAPNNHFVLGMYKSRRRVNRYRLVVDTSIRGRASMGAVQGGVNLLWKARAVREKLTGPDRQGDSRPPTGFRKAGS